MDKDETACKPGHGAEELMVDSGRADDLTLAAVFQAVNRASHGLPAEEYRPSHDGHDFQELVGK